MQVQTIISGSANTRYFPFFDVPSLAVFWAKCHSTSARLILGRWFENPAVDGASQRLVTAAGSQHSLTGVDTRKTSKIRDRKNKDCSHARLQSLDSVKQTKAKPGAGMSIDSPACSSLTTNSQPSNPCSRAHDLRSLWHALDWKTRSPLETWCNCGQALIRTGRQVCSWFVRSARTAASVVSYCGPTEAAAGRPGTHTPRQRSSGSARPRSLPPVIQSTAWDTVASVRNVWEEIRAGACSRYYVNPRASAPTDRHNIRYRRLGRAPPYCFCPHCVPSAKKTTQWRADQQVGRTLQG